MTDESTQIADLTIEDVFDAAVAEVEGLATDTDTTTVSPTVEVEADDSVEQTEDIAEEAESEQADDTFDFEDIEEEEDTPTKELDLTIKVPVKDHGELTIEELRNGYMMQADYTRSKQALKAEQEQFTAQNEAAAKIMESLENDPVGLAAYLAVETGLLTEQDLNGKDVGSLREAVKVPKATEMEAEIERQVAERLEQHPDVQNARTNQVKAAIEREFQQIEKSVGKPLSEAAKLKIVDYAAEHSLMDLTVAFDALSASTARKREQSAKLKAAAPERPGTRSTEKDVPKVADSVEDAFALAMALHGE